MHTDAVKFAHLAYPPWMHPASVIVGRLADVIEPETAVQRLTGDVLGAFPRRRLVDAIRDSVTREGELTREMAARVLVDHAADSMGVIAGEHPVDHHLGDCHLSADGFAPGFEVDRVGKAFLMLGAGRALEAEAFGRALRSMFLIGHLALRGYGLIARRLHLRRDIWGCRGGFAFLRLEYGGL